MEPISIGGWSGKASASPTTAIRTATSWPPKRHTGNALARTPRSTLPLGIGAGERACAAIDRANGAIYRPAFTSQEVTVPRKLFGLIAIAAACLFPMHVALAHSGGTDAYGCHTNHKTGVYHCHYEAESDQGRV